MVSNEFQNIICLEFQLNRIILKIYKFQLYDSESIHFETFPEDHSH